MKRLHVFYSGRVHGVGFRYTAQDLAVKYAIMGWVKNTPDGRVELVAEGNEKNVNQFIASIESTLSAYITNKTFYDEPPSGEEKSFRIVY